MSGLGKAILFSGAMISLASFCHAETPTSSDTTTQSETSTFGGLPFYAEFFGGASQSPDLNWSGTDFEMDTGYNVGAAFGVSVNDQFDLEVETIYTSAYYEGFDETLSSLNFMVSGSYNIPLTDRIEGYVGGGVGVMYLHYVNDGASSS